ncbi:hypothetical protein ACWGIA_16960 [Streptomyces bobili]
MLPWSSSFPLVNSPNTSGYFVLAAAADTSGGVSPTWVWSAVGAIVTSIGITLVILYRRRDARAKTLMPGYDAAGKALVVLNRLVTKSAISGVTSELVELADLVSLLTIAEARSPEIPFGVIVAELNDYLKNVLPHDYAARIAVDHSLLDSYLLLVRLQGIKLEATRVAITIVQRRIEKLTGK